MLRSKQKRTGAHFTPSALAAVVAERLVRAMDPPAGSIRILDPSCGEGNLLQAIAEALSPGTLARCTLIGIEDDPDSFATLKHRLVRFRGCTCDLVQGDFLDFFDDGSMFGPAQILEPVDVIIANPPYVRTQVLGADRAQELAARFGLSGRVDLYQAFLVAMAKQLKPGGLLGVIMSNRFLSTMGGAATRRFLRSQFKLLEVVDLGDTKLFEAAVLPALLFGVKRSSPPDPGERVVSEFLRIYEKANPCSGSVEPAGSIFDLLRNPKDGLFAINGTTYHVATGRIEAPEDEAIPWVMLTTTELKWTDRVRDRAAYVLGDVAKIRVGIKTTADKVFIRRDWSKLPLHQRPEVTYLKPLLSHDDSAKWRAAQNIRCPKYVLYTHEVVDGVRRPISFAAASTAWAYLQVHRKELESRRYVIDAGRKWYEIWVPQDPKAWALKKIVLPDISPEPQFFLDRGGCIVDGNCYWITTNDPEDEELLLLIMGVANSSVMARYHELAFQNKLYSQRRRYLAQYVAKYPLPDRHLNQSRRVVELVRRLVGDDTTKDEQAKIETEVDELVADAFGVPVPDFTDTVG